MSTPKPYYFDCNATTPVAPEVVAAMLPYFTEHWGNPSSAYAFGRTVAKRIETAREQVAALIHADPKEVVFTGCGTESINTAIHAALMVPPGKRHIITTAVEHSATLEVCRRLERHGYEVTYLEVDHGGALDLRELETAIRPDTALASIMWANNETGVLFPIQEIVAICHRKGVPVHTDAVQMAGKLDIDVGQAGVDFLSLSAHKLYAPKGIGALVVRRRVRFQPHLVGGHQENGRRAGTENVPYIVGFGCAAELAAARLDEMSTRIRHLRDRMELSLLRSVPDTSVNGAPEPRLPNTSNFAFDNVDAEAILMGLDQLGICASSGSACTTGTPAPSHVLTAMGLSPQKARGSVRLSLGIHTTDADVDYLLAHLPCLVARLRASLPFAPPPGSAATASPT